MKKDTKKGSGSQSLPDKCVKNVVGNAALDGGKKSGGKSK